MPIALYMTSLTLTPDVDLLNMLKNLKIFFKNNNALKI
jgi:hypothetical protein